jgi:hypothetical protein
MAVNRLLLGLTIVAIALLGYDVRLAYKMTRAPTPVCIVPAGTHVPKPPEVLLKKRYEHHNL